MVINSFKCIQCHVVCSFQVFDQSTSYEGVKSRAGANDNIDHKAGGGTTKVWMRRS